MSLKTERIAIRKLIKSLGHYAQTNDCERGCKCDACKAIRYGLRQILGLTEIINANKRLDDYYKGL